MNKLSNTAHEQAQMLEEALHEIFSRGRRDFLKKGSLVALAAVSIPLVGASLSSCKSDAVSTNDTNASDASILSTAYLVEKLAINTYTYAAGTGLLTGAFLQVASSFISDHGSHAQTFKNVITGELGGTMPTEPTASENFVTGLKGGTVLKIPPTFGNLTSAEGIIKYALGLELTAATLYFDNATNADGTKRLTHAAATNAVMDIAPVEMEHAAVFRAALKLLLSTSTDTDNANVGNAIAPHAFISLETPRP